MATTDYRYAINGVVSTDRTVLQNLDALAQATGAWLTYDINQGRWAVVINRAGNAVASFGDHNIIGAITVSGTALTSMYNSVQVQFPHVDLKNTTDSVLIEIPLVDRNPNEPERQLNLSTDLVIDPVQAQLIGYMELQQSRIDTVISFVTDFTSLGLKAGDIIDVSSSIYGLTNLKFRIITIRESDTDTGEIQLAITAQLYSDAVYDTTGLIRYNRISNTGIVGIGNIGLPGVPTVTLTSTNTIPHVAIASSAPSGIVSGMEFFYSTDTEVVYDENRSYNLAGTVTAANGTFTFGETVRFDYYDAPTGNLIVKTRGINDVTVGPFSQPTGNVTYAPTQTAGAITNQTKVIDSTGQIITSLGASFLLNQLSSLFGGNSNQTITQAITSLLGKSDVLNKLSVSEAAAAAGFSINNLGKGNFQLDYGGKKVSIPASTAVLKWTFTDGLDLDIRARVITPDIGQNSVDQSIGYTDHGEGNTTAWPTSGTPILTWGGDNTGTGSETVYINLARFRTLYPSATKIAVEARANWYTTVGYNPVVLTAVVYQGGTISASGFDFVNAGFTNKKAIAGLESSVTSFHGEDNEADGYSGATAPGDLIGYFIYDFSSNSAQITASLQSITPPETETGYSSQVFSYNYNDDNTSTFAVDEEIKMVFNLNSNGQPVNSATAKFVYDASDDINNYINVPITDGVGFTTFVAGDVYFEGTTGTPVVDFVVNSTVVDSITMSPFIIGSASGGLYPDEEVTTDEQDQPAPELPEGDYPEPEYDYTDYGDL